MKLNNYVEFCISHLYRILSSCKVLLKSNMIKSQIIHLDMLVNFHIVEFCMITRWAAPSRARG